MCWDKESELNARPAILAFIYLFLKDFLYYFGFYSGKCLLPPSRLMGLGEGGKIQRTGHPENPANVYKGSKNE